MKQLSQKFKKGATSIYVVVIATLLFSVITVSFIRIIINEANKTTSDELAQSAYDSALAGVEDTKTALKRYYECNSIEDAGSRPEDCANIITKINDGFDPAKRDDANYCDAVSEALGRTIGAGKGVFIKEETSLSSADEETIVQAYTCIKIDNVLNDYLGILDASKTVHVIKLKTNDPASVTGVRISWHNYEKNGTTLSFRNKNNFPPVSSGVATPPTLSAQIIQTANSYTLAQFSNSDGDKTNRGTVVLVPTDAGSTTHINKAVITDSNNHDYSGRASVSNPTNQPQKIRCYERDAAGSTDSDYACAASIEIPYPVGTSSAERNGDTFYLVLSLPYAQPTTDFRVQLCNDDEPGGTRGDCFVGGNLSVAPFTDVQISVDSTGRANDMYSRVEARVEFVDPFFPYPEFALQATSQEDDAIKKNFYVTENCIDTSAGDGSITSCDDTDDTD